MDLPYTASHGSLKGHASDGSGSRDPCLKDCWYSITNVVEYEHINERRDWFDVGDEDADLCDKERQDDCSYRLVLGVRYLEDAQEWNDVVAGDCL